MHVEKNVCDSLIDTLLNIQGKTKDGVNVRLDLVEMKIREDLAPREVGRCTYLPPCMLHYVQTREDKFLLMFKECQGTSRILFKNSEFSVHARVEACWHKVSRLPHLNATFFTCNYNVFVCILLFKL